MNDRDELRTAPGRVDRRTVLTGMTAVAVTAGMVTHPARASRGADPVVETAFGKVRGERVAGGGYKFLCVPYGASTAGEGRFMPPRPPSPWRGVREVPKKALIAPQLDPNAPQPAPGTIRAAISGIGSEAESVETEDCLNVTIYTPAIDSARRPVMFWCHGGGYFAGSGSNPMYDAAKLAVRGDVVVVNVNHRLNALGYAFLAEAGEEFAASGNVGMMDIALALQWVRENIERFGGDPRRVTIFGQSGGGGKVATLLSMPSAKGLFHRAVMQSGALRQLRAPEDAAAVSATFMAQLGLKPHQGRELQQVPLEKLMAANFALGRLPAKPGKPLNFMPVLDGTVVPRNPFDPVANPLNADVPLMIGCTRTENTAFMVSDESAFTLDAAALSARMRALIGERAGDAAVETYTAFRPGASPSDLYFEMLSDRSMRRSSIQVADLKVAQAAARTYLYELTWNTPVFGGRLRSPHSLDLPLIFDIAEGDRWRPYTGGGSDAQTVARAMSAAWVAFAHTGDPGTAALPWPAYTLERRETMLFDETSGAKPDPFRPTRRFWEDVANAAI
ncbi:MAG: carboxylesterase/lipase family protein [Steroidobacteraceae bacterium]|nr:carboxylesterase/lipase family protein [Steroidobacteraceae bacterium]